MIFKIFKTVISIICQMYIMVNSLTYLISLLKTKSPKNQMNNYNYYSPGVYYPQQFLHVLWSSTGLTDADSAAAHDCWSAHLSSFTSTCLDLTNNISHQPHLVNPHSKIFQNTIHLEDSRITNLLCFDRFTYFFRP